MTSLRTQAITLLNEIPNEQMKNVIDFLYGMKNIFTNPKDTEIQADKKTSANRLKAWSELKKYKGIVTSDVNEKSELAGARDEKFANFI